MLVEYKSDLYTRFIPSEKSRKRFEVRPPFDFAVDGVSYRVPAGFYTDFASVPAPVHPIIGPHDLGCGPIPHDYGYFTGMMSRAYWDEVFLACMELDGISWWKRRAAYNAVRSFGWATWNDYRRKNKTHTLHLAASGSYEIEGWEREAVA